MTNQNNPNTYCTGDLVVGSSDPGKSVYSPTGAKIISTGVTVYGAPEDLEAQAEEITKIALRYGGKKLASSNDTISKKKTKTKKAVSSQKIETYTYQEPVALSPAAPSTKITSNQQTVQFENDFGKIKVKVEALIEHEQAYMLVFTDETSIIFEPKIGETLKFHTQYAIEEVYYPGVIFNSPGDDARFMLLFKVPQENQE